VPLALKRAIGVGIGLFILFIGFVDGGLIRQPAGDGPVPVEFVFPNSWNTWLTVIGLLITIVLYVRKVPAALVLSIVITSVLALVTGVTSVPGSFSASISFGTIGQFDVGNVFSTLGVLAAILTIFTIMLADFFDTMGTATAITEQAGLTTPDGQVPGIGRVLLVDSVAAIAGGAAGISSNTTYIESAAGVAEGGRTGFTAVVVGVLFLFMILLSPLVTLVPFAATSPVLILVGFLMTTLIKDINFADFEEGLPALLGIMLMPLTFSITVGIGAAFVSYVAIKVIVGKVRDIHPLMWVVAAGFAIYFGQSAIGSILPK
jgi:AGZA family xanthine/uracil permease-like MFS transporter